MSSHGRRNSYPGPRGAAARVLAEICAGKSLGTALPAALKSTKPDDKALVQELVYGSLRGWPKYAAIAHLCLRKPMKAKDNDVLGLIILGLYQLSAMRVPEHAAVSETVESARKLGKPWASSLINGILRSFLRDRDGLHAQLTPAQHDAMPEWLWKTLQAQWPKHAQSIIAAAQQRPPMTLRVNTQKTDRDSYQQLLTSAGIEAYTSETVPSALTLVQPLDVEALPGFSSGMVSVQDASAQLAALLLGPKNNETILDACAAPGGKSCHLLELAPNSKFTAADINEDRLMRIRENTARLGLNPEIIELDARSPNSVLGERQFDAILADVPCSATGVIRRNPDIKLLRLADDPLRFASQQREILQGLWPLLKPGGRLLYVTCSILHEENDARIAEALTELPDIKLGRLPLNYGQATELGVQVLPSTEGGDGLYFALLEKAPN